MNMVDGAPSPRWDRLTENDSTETAMPQSNGVPEKLVIRQHNLPHWQFGGSTYFITFGSLRGDLDTESRNIVMKHCVYDHGTKMNLHFGIVMPDHVHLILQPKEHTPKCWFDLSEILQGIKSVSSRNVNRHQNTKGVLWQDESFDRIIRDEAEYLEKLNYIYWNPVKAGLVAKPKDYPFFLNPMKVMTFDD
jgi:putative transposase